MTPDMTAFLVNSVAIAFFIAALFAIIAFIILRRKSPDNKTENNAGTRTMGTLQNSEENKDGAVQKNGITRHVIPLLFILSIASVVLVYSPMDMQKETLMMIVWGNVALYIVVLALVIIGSVLKRQPKKT
ncbi:MAG: hypothetical protein HYY60_01845 [Parcubacteria group bacterium]|nr:hypothetical protein [Parcubacteria group bacterium]MBI3074620.1 hypothetical protein [Parcubacteria group bacterium]